MHSLGLKFGDLFRCRLENLRRTARRPRPRISGRPAIRRVGRRLSEIRLVQHRRRRMRRLPTPTCATRSTQVGRPIVLSICEWGTAKPWLWGKEVGGNLWRTTGDIQDMWAGRQKWPDGSCCSNGVLAILDQQVGLAILRGARTLERSRHAGSR